MNKGGPGEVLTNIATGGLEELVKSRLPAKKKGNPVGEIITLYDASLLIALILVGLILGYHAQKQQEKQISEIMQSWIGAHESQLYLQWGPPTEVYSDGAGGKIVVYTIRRQFVAPGSARTTVTDYGFGMVESRTTYTPPRIHEWSVYRAFWINPQGYIYHWAWRGL